MFLVSVLITHIGAVDQGWSFFRRGGATCSQGQAPLEAFAQVRVTPSPLPGRGGPWPCLNLLQSWWAEPPREHSLTLKHPWPIAACQMLCFVCAVCKITQNMHAGPKGDGPNFQCHGATSGPRVILGEGHFVSLPFTTGYSSGSAKLDVNLYKTVEM